MRLSIYECGFPKVIVLTIAIGLLLTVTTGVAQAKRGDDDRSEFRGIVQARPERGMQGEWVIGGRTFNTDAGTEFDESEGRLTVGSCAKVDVRSGRVHEIDSEPMRDCE